MRKITIYTILAIMAFPAIAQDFEKHEFLFRGAVGGTSLQTDVAGITSKVGLGGGAGLGYNFFFSSKWGVGTGIELGFYNASTTIGNLTGDEWTTDLSSSESFRFQYEAQNYEEKQSINMLTIPLLVNFQTGEKYTLYASAGLRIGIPLSSKAEQTAAQLTTSGFYPALGYVVTDVPEAGFATISNYSASGNLDLKTSCILSVEAGLKWKLIKNWNVYTGLYLDYGLNNIQKTADKQVVHYQADKPAVFEANSILNTPKNDGIHTLSFGVRIGVAFSKGLAK